MSTHGERDRTIDRRVRRGGGARRRLRAPSTGLGRRAGRGGARRGAAAPPRPRGRARAVPRLAPLGGGGRHPRRGGDRRKRAERVGGAARRRARARRRLAHLLRPVGRRAHHPAAARTASVPERRLVGRSRQARHAAARGPPRQSPARARPATQPPPSPVRRAPAGARLLPAARGGTRRFRPHPGPVPPDGGADRRGAAADRSRACGRRAGTERQRVGRGARTAAGRARDARALRPRRRPDRLADGRPPRGCAPSCVAIANSSAATPPWWSTSRRSARAPCASAGARGRCCRCARTRSSWSSAGRWRRTPPRTPPAPPRPSARSAASDAYAARSAGLPAITITGSDPSDRLDEDTLAAAEAFCIELLARIDALSDD